jgi:hypothetical protein
MRKSRFADAQIIGMIKEQEAGFPTTELCQTVPKAWIEPCNGLQDEGQIWWDGVIRCQAPEAA